ncbi:MAG: hypothetical protein KF708_06045 [Pirellulales bacterium]|nr:hypothetical protein [Pirellulales bacterium]
MSSARDQIFDAVLKLSEEERLLLVGEILDSLPEELPGLSADDTALLDELERRAQDTMPSIPLSNLWTRE